ncbi:hypothetical protein RIF29_29966 [Crotalaria pallida]|uniref:Uncharacterized protein n=1 Tax=Crotalaria pallida TaxID=3830 RepID=A0AAN9EKN2_CROPI
MKLVLKLDMGDDKDKKKAFKTISTHSGFVFLAAENEAPKNALNQVLIHLLYLIYHILIHLEPFNILSLIFVLFFCWLRYLAADGGGGSCFLLLLLLLRIAVAVGDCLVFLVVLSLRDKVKICSWLPLGSLMLYLVESKMPTL